MKKISVNLCLATKSYYPLYAGPAVRFQRYGQGLAKRNIRMQVFTQAVTDELIARDGSLAEIKENKSQREENKKTLPLFEMVDNIPVQRAKLSPNWRRHQMFFRDLVRYCKDQREKIDVIQILSLNFWALPYVYQLRRMGMGTVFTHTLLGDFSSNRWRQRWQRFQRSIPFNLVDYVVVSSSSMKEQLEKFKISVPIQVIPNGVDLRRFHPISDDSVKAQLRRQLGLNPKWDVILAIGPIVPRKGTDALVEAFTTICHEFPNAHLVLVGSRHDLNRPSLKAFHQKLQHIITTTDTKARVIFTGAVSNVQDYLQAADFLVFPSHREGMPNVVPEAMACGLPVIMTHFLGLPDEFGIPGQHYILSDWDTKRLANDIRIFLAEPSRRAGLGQAARRWVEQNLDVEKSLDDYAALYRKVNSKIKEN